MRPNPSDPERTVSVAIVATRPTRNASASLAASPARAASMRPAEFQASPEHVSRTKERVISAAENLKAEDPLVVANGRCVTRNVGSRLEGIQAASPLPSGGSIRRPFALSVWYRSRRSTSASPLPTDAGSFAFESNVAAIFVVVAAAEPGNGGGRRRDRSATPSGLAPPADLLCKPRSGALFVQTPLTLSPSDGR
jgi:hypothetical protein